MNISRRETKKQQAILNAIEGLLMSGRSYADLSVGEIAAAAGTSRSTFYLHFSDKSDVIGYLLDKLMAELIAVSDMASAERAWTSRDTLRKALVDFAEVYCRNVASLTAIAEVASRDKEINKRYFKMVERAAFVRKERMIAEQSTLKIREDLPEGVPVALTWMVERTISQYVTVKTKTAVLDDARAMKIIDGLTDVIWTTLYGCSTISSSR